LQYLMYFVHGTQRTTLYLAVLDLDVFQFCSAVHAMG